MRISHSYIIRFLLQQTNLANYKLNKFNKSSLYIFILIGVNFTFYNLISNGKMRRQNKQTDRYTAVKQIGKGSFGQVYKGIDKINKNQVALKFIQKRGKSFKDIQSLKQQNKLLKNIHHQNIINFIDFLQNQKEIIIVTDYAGSDLARVLQLKKKFPLDKVKNYCKQILKAMLYLNQNRIIHRDLKPQNILIQQDHIKICDFGFAKKLSASTNFLKSIKGTPLYLAPQIVAQRAYTQKVDVWSFGCIIYQLFSGCPPFYATDYRRLAPKILHQPVKYPIDMPSELRSLITNMLDKHDKTRYNWSQVKNHIFFKQVQPLSQIGINIPKLELQLKLQKKISSKQQEQNAFYQQSRVLQKLDSKIELEDFIIIQKQIKINSKELRQDPCFQYKINFVFRQKCRQDSSISNQIIQKILDILVYLAKSAKQVNKNQQCIDDIIKKQILITSILSIARLQTDFNMLEKQLKTLCYLIKVNFDGIQVNPIINQQITQFITIILEKDNLPVQCLTNGLLIIGTLANQAILTYNRSQDYFVRIYQDKIMTKICNFYKKKQDFGTVLMCIQQFIHPSSKIPEGWFQSISKILGKLKLQVAEALLNTDFISQISPLQIYKKNNGYYLKYYMTILLECLQISSQMRKKYVQFDYWNELLNHQVTKPFAFVFNYLLTQKEGINSIITRQLFKSFVKLPDDNKLVTVYIMHSGYMNIKKSKLGFQKSRALLEKTLLQKIFDILASNKQQKQKAVKQVYGQLGFVPKHFDEIIIKTLSQLVQSVQRYQNKLQIQQNIKLIKKILNFLSDNSNNFEPTICSLKNLMNVFVKQKNNIIFSQNDAHAKGLQLFFYKAIQQCLRREEFAQLVEKQQTQFITITVACLNKLNDFYQSSTNQEIVNNIAILTYGSNFYKRLFPLNLSQFQFHSSLRFLLRIITKCLHLRLPQAKQTMCNYLGNNVVLRCKVYLKAQNQNLLIQICNLFSFLSRETSEYNKLIQQSTIIQYFQSWLISQDKSELLKDKVLYLIGNLAKKSDYFFNDFNRFGAAKAIVKCLQKYPQSQKILKDAIYAVGNISFYNDKFSKQFQPLVPYFARALKTQQNLKNNLISTISNLLRFTDVYLYSLLKTELISQIVNLFCKCQTGESVLANLCLSVFKKLLPYKQALKDQELLRIYERKLTVKCEQMDVMNKIQKLLISKGLMNGK